MKLFIAWLVAFIVTQAPANRPTFIPEAKETVPEAEARYESIAHDIAEVVSEPTEPPLFKGTDGRIKTAAAIEAIMAFEGGFRKDVDLGKGGLSKGDGGQSWCLMQIRLGAAGTGGKTQQRIVLDPDGLFHFAFDGKTGLGGEDLVKDRKNCIRAGLHIMRKSFTDCASLSMLNWLNEYASGSCDRGYDASKNRLSLALRYFKSNPPGFVDADFYSAKPAVVPAPVIVTPAPVTMFPRVPATNVVFLDRQ